MKTILFLITLLITTVTFGQSLSLAVDSAGQVASDSVYQFSKYDVSGQNWSLTIEADTCDSVIFSIGGSNYEINTLTHVFDFDALTGYPDTFVRAANYDTINGTPIETKSYYGSSFPFKNAAIRVYKHATFKDTANFKLLFYK